MMKQIKPMLISAAISLVVIALVERIPAVKKIVAGD